MSSDPCCGTKEGTRCWFNLDVCGILPFELGECALFYVFFFLSKCVIFGTIQNSFLKYLLFLPLCFLYLMAVISHMRCCFSDPGSVPSNASYLPDALEDEKLLYCTKCDAYKPPRAHHCSQCNRCIIRMDHHCPWINNCVGFKNMKFFVLFLGYVIALCVYTILLDIYRLVYSYKHVTYEDLPVIIGTMLTLSLAVLFFFFTSSMMIDALTTIRTNTTLIDRKKGISYAGNRSAIGDYFGDNGVFHLSWIFPVSPRFKYLEEIRGFCIHSYDV